MFDLQGSFVVKRLRWPAFSRSVLQEVGGLIVIQPWVVIITIPATVKALFFSLFL